MDNTTPSSSYLQGKKLIENLFCNLEGQKEVKGDVTMQDTTDYGWSDFEGQNEDVEMESPESEGWSGWSDFEEKKKDVEMASAGSDGWSGFEGDVEMENADSDGWSQFNGVHPERNMKRTSQNKKRYDEGSDDGQDGSDYMEAPRRACPEPGKNQPELSQIPTHDRNQTESASEFHIDQNPKQDQ
jgi:hypothetical protein